MACSDSNDRFGGGPDLQFGMDDSQLISPSDVCQDADGDKQAMELDPDNNLPPPPRGHPTDAPVAAASVPQGALQLMAAGARQSQGKPPHYILAKHVPDNIKRCIWANKYVDFQYLIESDPTEEIVYQFVASSNNAVALKPTKPKSKLDGWAAWNKAFHMFTEIYCMKYPDSSIKLLQYSGHLNNLAGKFPFDQVYAYDKEFRADLEWFPDKPWDQIDQQLWSLTLHGIHTMPHQENPQQYQFWKQQLQQQGWKCHRARHLTTSTEIVLITTEEAATTPLASSNMYVADVDHQLTQPHFAHNESSNNKAVQQQQPHSQILQLAEETYIPPMPLKHNQLSELL